MKKLCALALLLGGCSAQHATVEPAPQVVVVVATPTPVGAPAAPGSATPVGNLVAAPTLVPKPTISKEEAAWIKNFTEAVKMLKVDPNMNAFGQAATFRGTIAAAKQLYDSVPVPPRFQDADGYMRESLAAADEAGVHMRNLLTNNTPEETDAVHRQLSTSQNLMNKAFDAVDDVLKASQ